MRFREFKTVLREFVEPDIQKGIESLDDIGDSVVDNPEIASEIGNILQDLMKKVQPYIQKGSPTTSNTPTNSTNTQPAPVPQQQPATQPATIKQSVPLRQNPQGSTPNKELPPGSPIQEELPAQTEPATKPAGSVATREFSVEECLEKIKYFKSTLPYLPPEIQAQTIKEIESLERYVPSLVSTAKQQGGEEKEEELKGREKEIRDATYEVAKRIGLGQVWGKKLYGVLIDFENNFGEKLINHIKNGTALKTNWSTITTPAYNKVNLKDIINPDLMDLFNPENSEAFGMLKNMPLGISSGQGQGSGPGETLLTLLVPEATKAPKGDVYIGDGMWEVKGGKYDKKNNSLSNTNAWLEAVDIKAPALRAKFSNIMHSYLKSSWNKKVKTLDGTAYTLSDLSRLADFRPKSIWALSYLFKQLKPQQSYDVLEQIYDTMFPSLKKRNPQSYDSVIRKSLQAIEVQDTTDTLSDLHAKLAMWEYMIGEYKAKGIVLFNATTNEFMIMQGAKGINSGLSTGTVSTQTITMHGKGDAKASPGIFLGTSDRGGLETQLGIQRTRPHKSPQRKMRETQ